MISASGHEQGARITPHNFVEAKRVVIKRLGLRDIVDVEVHVPEHSTFRNSVPSPATGGADEILDIEMLGSHVQLTLLVAPCVARTIRVNLDAKAVRIGEVDSLAHEMIGHSGVCADTGQVRNKSAKRCAIG